MARVEDGGSVNAAARVFGGSHDEEAGARHDLVVHDADLLVTMTGDEIPGGWVAVKDGRVSAIGAAGNVPPSRATLSASGCLVTPGLVNTHHHLFQNLTRAYRPATDARMPEWFDAHRRVWATLDEEAAYLSAWVGLAELALGGCTMSTDDLFLHPRPLLVDATIQAAQALGFRFHPVRDGLDLPLGRGGIVPGELSEDVDAILADGNRLISTYNDRSPNAMIRVGLSACGLWGCSRRFFEETSRLAESLDVELFTHFLETPTEEAHVVQELRQRPVEVLEETGWASSRSLLAHGAFITDQDTDRVGSWGVGVAHCPSSNAMICEGITPVRELVAAGARVGLGCDGSASSDHGSLWLEARTALLLAKLRHGPQAMSARDVLRMATVESAACLGREDNAGVISVGSCGDLVAWPLQGMAFAGAVSDPVEAWLRCGPISARHTVINGTLVVRDGMLEHHEAESILAQHRRIAVARQAEAGPGGAA